MELDGLEKLDVADRPAEADPDLGMDLAEPARVDEDPLLLGVDELDHVGVRRKVPAGPELRDLGVDRLHPALARDRDPMVAVDDEVGVPELVDDDRGEGRVGEGPFEPLPPFAEVRAPRVELSVEVATAAVGADDLAQGDRPQPDVAARKRAQAPGRLVERQELARTLSSSEDAREPCIGVPPSGPVECGSHAIYNDRRRSGYFSGARPFSRSSSSARSLFSSPSTPMPRRTPSVFVNCTSR